MSMSEKEAQELYDSLRQMAGMVRTIYLLYIEMGFTPFEALSLAALLAPKA